MKSQTFEVDIFDSNSSWTVKSPDGKYEITVLIANGKIYYTASANGSVIAKLSRLGLKTSLTITPIHSNSYLLQTAAK